LTSASIDSLLGQAERGDRDSESQLIALVYAELRVVAHRCLHREQGALTLSTTALVNEAYLKIVQSGPSPYRHKAYFFAAAAQAMRQVIVDLARVQHSLKRGAGQRPITLDSVEIALDDCAGEMLELDRALTALAAIDPRLARVVEYRYFGGMSEEETARLLGITARTVRRDWRKARAWLYTQLNSDDSGLSSRINPAP